jgi:hypothetical protein
MNIIKYRHEFGGGNFSNNFVFDKLKGKHRSHCLCFLCDKFFPNTTENCKIAQATFENCVKFNTVTPMYECPEFRVRL